MNLSKIYFPISLFVIFGSIAFGDVVKNQSLIKMALEGAFNEKVASENINLDLNTYLFFVDSYEFSADIFVIIEKDGKKVNLYTMTNQDSQIVIKSVSVECDVDSTFNKLARKIEEIRIIHLKKLEGKKVLGGEYFKYAYHIDDIKSRRSIRSEVDTESVFSEFCDYLVELMPDAKNVFLERPPQKLDRE